MNITCPVDCLELLKDCEAEKEKTGPWAGMLPDVFYKTLELVPEFARDPKIHSLLLDAVKTEPWGQRIQASTILHQIGDPLGILHLTYNSLCQDHPLLKQNQMCSGWSDAVLLRHADKLTDECVDLLINDLEQPNAIRHMDILATLPGEKIIPRMRALLGNTKTSAMAAAYVLAMKGNDEGRPLLDKLVESQKFIDLALIALSHIPDEQTIRYLRAYSDPAHPIYNKKNDGKTMLLQTGLMRHAQCRLFFLECRDPYPARRTMEQFYFHSIQKLIAKDYYRSSISRDLSGPINKQNAYLRDQWVESASHWVTPPPDFKERFFVVNSTRSLMELGTGVSAPDFLCEFATHEDLVYCAEIQRSSMRALLDVIDWTTLGNGSDMGISPTFLWGLKPVGTELGFRNLKIYFPGFKLSYGKEDYEHAAVDWILNPSRYRFNSYWPHLIIQ